MRRLVGGTGGDGGAWRRLRLPAAAGTLALVGAVAVPGLAAAQPDPTAPPENGETPPPLEVPEAVPGEEVCTIADPRLVELSGLVATEDGFIVINDGQLDDALRPIFFLDLECNVVDEQSFFPGQPRDPEDLELDYDSGALWVGDTGDNQAAGTAEGEPRETVALWRVDLTADDGTPVIHRFVYPDGEPRDAEALLLDGDGVPIIVTKTVGAAQLYKPTELRPDNPPEEAVPLELVGEFDPPDTGTDNRFAAAGRRVITGGAVSPDGTAVVLRTYADALEFDLVDGDVVTAITTGQPRVTPLPGEPQGEAITYTPDGQRFLTVSDAPAEDVGNFTPVILGYTPTPPPPEPTQDEEVPPPAAAGGQGFTLFNSVQDIVNMIAAVGVLGLILVAVGVFGIVRARRRAAAAEQASEDAAADHEPGEGPVGAAAVPAGAAAVPASAAAMGRSRPPAEPEQGWEPGAGGQGHAQPAGVYTSRASAGYGAPEYAENEYRGTGYDRGTEYGGAAEYRGTEYGGGGTEYGGGGTEYGGAAAGYGPTEHGGTEHGGTEYGGAQYAGTDYGGTHHGGTHHGGTHHGGTDFGSAERAGGAAAGYGPTDYHGTEYGGTEYGGATEYRGNEYGGARRGGAEYAGQEYGRAEHAAGGYSDQPYPPGWSDGEQGYPPPYADGPSGVDPANGAHRPRQGEPDYYSEDPDYPYEFRQPGRW